MKGVIYVTPHCLLNCSSILKSRHNYFLKYLTFLQLIFYSLFIYSLLNHSFFSISHSVFESKDHIAFITSVQWTSNASPGHTSGFLKTFYSTLNTKDLFPTWSKAIEFPNCSCLLYFSDVNISSSGKKKKKINFSFFVIWLVSDIAFFSIQNTQKIYSIIKSWKKKRNTRRRKQTQG